MEQIFISFLNTSITAGYLILAVMLLRPILKKAPKYIRCILWGMVGLRLVLPFSFQSVLSLIPSAEPVPQEIVYSPTPAIHTGISFLNSSVNPILTESLAPTPEASVNPMQIVMAIAWNVWLIGMAAMVLYSVISYILLKRKLREGVHQTGHIWLCDRIGSPFLLGLFRPRIYLPSSLKEEDAVYVIAHEEAHIRRKDHWWKPIGFLLLTVYWFHPLVWVAYIFLCRDIEFACDEKVIREMGTDCKKAYSEALINCSIPRKMISACPVAFGEDSVKGRVKSVLSYKKPAFWIILVAIIVCIAVAVCFLTDPPDDPANPTVTDYHFRATVLEVRQGSLLVKPLDPQGIQIADQIVVTIPKDNTDTFAVDDWIQVHYDGMVQELYPPILPNVSTIWILNPFKSTLFPSDYAYVYGAIDQAEFDIDNDGIAEYCAVTYGPTSGLFTFVMTAFQNGVPEYRNIFESAYPQLSFRTLDNGKTVLVSTPQWENTTEQTFDISVKGNEIVLSAGTEAMAYWGNAVEFYGPTITDVKKDFPHFLNLPTAKGLEVYVWKNGDWRCGVRSGTNRNASLEELWAFGNGANLNEMALILSTYHISTEDVVVQYSYDPAFSGEAPNPPSAEEQELITQTLFAYLPFRLATEPYIAPEYDAQKTYQMVVYGFQLGENGWRFLLYKNNSIGNTIGDAVMGFNSLSAEDASKILAEFGLPPEEIPVIVINSYISSYYYEITQQTVLQAREILGLS